MPGYGSKIPETVKTRNTGLRSPLTGEWQNLFALN